MGLLMKNSPALCFFDLPKSPLRRGVSAPACIGRPKALFVPLGSREKTLQGLSSDLICARTRIPTKLLAKVSAAFSLYNLHSQS